VLAAANGLTAPFDAATTASLQALLGVTVTAEASCEYFPLGPANEAPIPLWTVVFGTTPPVRVKSGELGTVELAGKDYAVWVWSDDSVSMTLYPR
jgi:hypothetical protein